MAKLSKNALKEIVKECLVEILAEGISSNSSSSLSEAFDNHSSLNRAKSKNLKNILPPKKSQVPNERFEKNISNLISKTTSDPIMSEIFADTATSTLQEQNSADSARGKFVARSTDEVTNIVAQSNPEDLFGGEASSNWAKLAFSSKEY